jgi:hypothetical protein
VELRSSLPGRFLPPLIASLCNNLFCSPSLELRPYHCFVKYRRVIANTFVHVGTNRLNQEGNKYASSQLKRHPNYNENTISNDVALVITANTIVIGGAVQIINLGLDVIGAGVPVVLTGWGTTSVSSHSLLLFGIHFCL